MFDIFKSEPRRSLRLIMSAPVIPTPIASTSQTSEPVLSSESESDSDSDVNDDIGPDLDSYTEETTGIISEQNYKLAEYSIVFVGNPGAGKSSLLNTLGGGFDAGYSAGGGRTKEMTTKNVRIRNVLTALVDLPGINEYENRAKNMKVLQKSIEQAKKIKVVFLVRSESGRIVDEDRLLIRYLLEGTKGISQVGIIINKCSKDDVQMRATLEKTCRDYISKVNSKKSLVFDFLFVRRHMDPETENEIPPPDTGKRLEIYLEGFVPTSVTISKRFGEAMKKFFDAIARIFKSRSEE